MFDSIMEILRTLVMLGITLYLWYVGRKRVKGRSRGWSLIVIGFGLVTLGSLIDCTDEYPSLTRFAVIGPTDLQATVESLFGYLTGAVLIAAGFIAWIPTVRRTENLAHELEQANERLVAAKEAAVQANQSRLKFMANMSHEIRTPLNGIIGMTQLACHASLDKQEREYLTTIGHLADTLMSLVNDILDFSHMENGRLSLKQSWFSLRNAVNTTIQAVQVRAEQKKLEISSTIDMQVPDNIVGDETRFRQVLMNLLDNAVKFTDQGAVAVHVTMLSKTQKSLTLHVTVADTGCGIEAEKHESILGAFEQGDTSDTRKFGGTGIGLAICSQLIDMMGGRLWFDSHVGSGSTFHFTVEMELQQQPAAETSPAATAIVTPTTPAIVANRLKEERPTDAQAHMDGLHILLAEDNLINQKMTARLLEEYGHTVTIAADGNEAVRTFTGAPENFDVILMDIQMPNMDGIEATQQIRAAQADHGHIPIIAVTAYAMQYDRERCLRAGMDGYVAKPFDIYHLLDVIQTSVQMVKG